MTPAACDVRHLDVLAHGHVREDIPSSPLPPHLRHRRVQEEILDTRDHLPSMVRAGHRHNLHALPPLFGHFRTQGLVGWPVPGPSRLLHRDHGQQSSPRHPHVPLTLAYDLEIEPTPEAEGRFDRHLFRRSLVNHTILIRSSYFDNIWLANTYLIILPGVASQPQSASSKSSDYKCKT